MEDRDCNSRQMSICKTNGELVSFIAQNFYFCFVDIGYLIFIQSLYTHEK